MRFENKVALITGAASGVGEATVALFRSEGATVVGIDRTAADGVIECDVTDQAAVQKVVADVVAEHGHLDVVCNVAGVLRMNALEDITLDTWNMIIGVNLTGPFIVAQATMPHLVQSGGNMVNVGSISGLQGQALNAAYTASKGGVLQLTRSLAVEFAAKGVRVNAVAPGGIDTPMVADPASQPAGGADVIAEQGAAMARMMGLMPGWIDPTEIAEAIAYLASDTARSVSGTTLVIDRATICA